jgi:hypothetical protein
MVAVHHFGFWPSIPQKGAGPKPRALVGYRLSRLAWVARRWRLRVLTDRRRRFIALAPVRDAEAAERDILERF